MNRSLTGALALTAALSWAPTAWSMPPHAEGAATCESCHAEAEGEYFAFLDGETRSVLVDAEVVKGSVHGEELECADCHRWKDTYPHTELLFEDAREYRVQMSQTCNRCHADHASDLRDSVHFEQIRAGDYDAPTCVDCHGAHDTHGADDLRLTISERCESCHEEEAEAYEASVHGESFLLGFEEAATCVDCHSSHEVKDPHSEPLQAASYQVCAKCHGDEEKMSKFDKSAHVVDSYLADFHGASNQIHAAAGSAPAEKIATCSDCHGAHDIEAISQMDPMTARAERDRMCESCHEDAPEGFGDAWLGHHPPSIDRSPVVWAVQWAYRILIPLIILALLMHVFMHLCQVRMSDPTKE